MTASRSRVGEDDQIGPVEQARPSRWWSSTTSSATTAPACGPGPTTRLGRIDGPTVAALQRPRHQPLDLAGAAAPRLRRPRRLVEPPRHRRLGPARRPDRVGIEEFVEDALSVMDHFGVDQAVLMGWSMGVNTAFELALRHPERVTGIFAVAGVPGDTFATMLGPLRLPARRRPRRSPWPSPGLLRHDRPGDHARSPPGSRRRPRRRGARPTPASCCPMPDPELAARAVARVPRARRSSGTSTSPCAPPSTPASR